MPRVRLQELRQKGPGRNDERTTWFGKAIFIDVVGIHRDLECERGADLILVACCRSHYFVGDFSVYF